MESLVFRPFAKALAAFDILLLFVLLNSYFGSPHHYLRHGDSFGIFSDVMICLELFILERVLASWAWVSDSDRLCPSLQVPAVSLVSGVALGNFFNFLSVQLPHLSDGDDNGTCLRGL